MQSPLVAGELTWRTASEIDFGYRGTTPLVESEAYGDQVGAFRLGNGYVIACSSPYIFSNRAFLDSAQAELAIRIIEYAVGQFRWGQGDRPPITINEYFNVSGSYRYTGVLFSPALRSGTLQFFLLAVLAAWMGFHRFGPAQDDKQTTRRTLTESAQAVGNLQYRSHDAGAVVGSYLDYLNSRLSRIYGTSVRLDDTPTLALRTGTSEARIREIIQRAQSMAGAKKVNAADAASAIRQLSELSDRIEHTGKTNTDQFLGS